jgi:hypothetical protein
MEESILNSIKKLLGPTTSHTYFDPDIIFHINSALAMLVQMGVGPKGGFRITASDEVWTDFLGDELRLDMAKDYVYLKVKLIFDPPTASAAIAAIERQIAEYEWRSYFEADPATPV